MARAVVSTISRDRPGIVDELTERVYGLGLSIEDSRMTMLGDEFAVLMLVTGDADALERLRDELEALLRPAQADFLFRPTGESGPETGTPYDVRVVAMDHPGIVHRIAAFFSSRRINIRDVETQTRPAPHTGTPTFEATMTVELPEGNNPARLRSEFEAYCEELGLDGTMSAAR